MTPDDRRAHHDAHTSLVNEIVNAISQRADCMALMHTRGRVASLVVPYGSFDYP